MTNHIAITDTLRELAAQIGAGVRALAFRIAWADGRQWTLQDFDWRVENDEYHTLLHGAADDIAVQWSFVVEAHGCMGTTPSAHNPHRSRWRRGPDFTLVERADLVEMDLLGGHAVDLAFRLGQPCEHGHALLLHARRERAVRNDRLHIRQMAVGGLLGRMDQRARASEVAAHAAFGVERPAVEVQLGELGVQCVQRQASVEQCAQRRARR